MKPVVAIIFTTVVLGYLAGSLGKRSFASESFREEISESQVSAGRGLVNNEGVPSTIKSNDTATTLAEIPGPELYDRLALWLLDASAAEMQEFWLSYSVRPDRSNNLNDLVFINWTRVDPEAAILAAEGTEFAHYPWRLWACHEPEKALREVLARYQGQEDQKRLGEVAWGLGEFHPDWLREHIDELPEEIRSRALAGYRKLADTENPRESIAFLKSQGKQIDLKTIASIGRENPLEAYELAVELEGQGYHDRGLPGDLIDSIANENPAFLEHLKDHIKAPQDQKKVALKQFATLLATDPEAAQKQIEELPAILACPTFVRNGSKKNGCAPPSKWPAPCLRPKSRRGSILEDSITGKDTPSCSSIRLPLPAGPARNPWPISNGSPKNLIRSLALTSFPSPLSTPVPFTKRCFP